MIPIKKNRYREKVENIITVNILFLKVLSFLVLKLYLIFKYFSFNCIFNF